MGCCGEMSIGRALCVCVSNATRECGLIPYLQTITARCSDDVYLREGGSNFLEEAALLTHTIIATAKH